MVYSVKIRKKGKPFFYYSKQYFISLFLKKH